MEDEKMDIQARDDSAAIGRDDAGIGEQFDIIADFAISVGGVKNGDRVAHVAVCDGRLSKKLHRLCAQDIPLDRWKALATGSMDVIFVSMALHHVNFPAQMIFDMKRILRPYGRLVVTEMSRYGNDLLKRDCLNRWTGFYTTDIRHWLKTAGFSNIIANPVPYQLLGLDANFIRENWGADIFLATGTA
jgi:SAM-dependent methyltransferase